MAEFLNRSKRMIPWILRFASRNRFWFGCKSLEPVWCFTVIGIFVTIVINAVLLGIYLPPENRSQQSNKIYKCSDCPSGVAPYVVPKNQSILYYDPTVKIAQTQPFSTCTWVPEGFTSTPERDCPPDSQYVLTPMIPMANSSMLTTTMTQAAQLIRNSSSNASIIYFQTISTIHCSIQYFSCYNHADYFTIQRVLANFNWTSFTVTFNHVSCDVTTVGSYLIIEADPSSQRKLFQYVRRLEGQITENGVRIHIPRVEQFHVTLAGVTYTYPSDCMVKILRTKLIPKLQNQLFGTVRICCFVTKIGFNIRSYYAQDCNPNDSCIFNVL